MEPRFVAGDEGEGAGVVGQGADDFPEVDGGVGVDVFGGDVAA
jgi:hypothetical protein